MKTKHIFSLALLVFAFVVYSCSSDSSDDGGPGGESQVTSIMLEASQQTINLGESVTFSVKTNLDTDVTANATYSADGTAISNNVFTPSSGGTYVVTASYEGLTSNQMTITVTDATIVSIEIESNVSTMKVGDTAEFTVIATNGSGNQFNVSSASAININGVVNQDNKYLAINEDDLTVNATYEGLNSNELSIPVNEAAVPGSFTKKGVIEDYTGTWCGWCPRVSYGIELVEEQSDKVFAIAAHIGDNMENTYSSQLRNQYNPGGSYPWAVLDRDATWTYPEPSNVAQAVATGTGTSSVGLSVNTLLRGNEITIHVGAGFTQNTTGNKLVVMMLEDGIVSSQDNYTSYYNGEDPISSFVHDHVLRHSFTNVLGDAIPANEQVANNVYNSSYTVNVPANVQSAFKTGIIAMVVDSNNVVVNAQYAKINVDKDFD